VVADGPACHQGVERLVAVVAREFLHLGMV
jgi:hypothetical protein